MPFINGRFYMNPAYGRALEAAREAEERNRRLEEMSAKEETDTDSADSSDDDSRWITKDHRHIFIHETQDAVRRTPKVSYASRALRTMFEKIARQSPTFAAELDALDRDARIHSVKIQEPGAAGLPDHAPGDTEVRERPDGTLDVTINVRDGDEADAEHEVGHVHDARTNTAQFFKDAETDKKRAGGPFELPHDQRPVEKRADRFRAGVDRERKQRRQ